MMRSPSKLLRRPLVAALTLCAPCALATSLAACGSSAAHTAAGTGGSFSSSTSSGGASSAGGGSTTGGGGDASAASCAFPPSILEGFVAGRTLYVSTTGSDANDGLTSTTAWATLAHSAALQPGDEIRVAAGTYPCPLLGPIAGTAQAPIHFVAAGAAKSAVLDCGGTSSILMTNLQYVAFDGLEIRNAASGAHCVNLFSGGAPYVNLTEHVLFIDDYIHDCGLSALKSSQSFEVEVRSSELSDNTTAGNPLIDFAGCHDMRVLGSLVHDGISEGIQMKGGAYNCLVEGNTIYNLGDSGINLGEATGLPYYLPGYTDWEAQDSIAANNLLYGPMVDGILVQGCNGCTVAHNTMWLTSPKFFIRGLSTQNGNPTDAGMGEPINTVGLVLEDNIFAASNTPTTINPNPGVPIPLNIPPPNDMGLVQGYNLYYSQAGNLAGAYSDTAIGGSGNLVDVSPDFVSTTTPDLHLAPGSPAIGVATPVPGVTRDFTGACRTDDDLGAW
jgi:hypothetical protein